MDFFCSLRVPVGAASSRPCRDGGPQWVVCSPVSIVVSPASGWLVTQVCGIWVAIPLSPADVPRPLAQGPSRCCKPPATSGLELPVGAAAPGSLASQCAPLSRCKFRLGFSGLRARTDLITLLLLTFLLMWPYGSPLPPCISLGCRIVEIAS
ncbi:hypothetical protein NDU88_005402 [Pleurodeles waltl]|uniref:Uncharacterized protein n=1 Tax=Pleurodeles waltl TaxID=8319 RepID=A0AAV7W7Q2_PLEWA|nr:hypothetical protein NDU88_005402 [Pleurodeles waltl]